MIDFADQSLNLKWRQLTTYLAGSSDKKPDLNGVLFLIGIQELGQGFKNFSKEQKQDLMHIAICKILSPLGYYTLEGHDQDGWPHWKMQRSLPAFDILEQEKLLKMQALDYFEQEIGLTLSQDEQTIA